MPLVNMRTLLASAQKSNRAVGAFNVGNMEMVLGVIRAAEQTGTPVIMQVAEGRLPFSPLEILGPSMIAAAKMSSAPVAVHLDHGKTLHTIQLALELGFTSVMFDGSALPLEENISQTRQIIALAKLYGAAVEGEIGRVGKSEDCGEEFDLCYSDPAQARLFFENAPVDALAISYGNSHGMPLKKPKLNFPILETIHRQLEVPLVLHGGTGISDMDFRHSIQSGITKINIATASFLSVCRGAKDYMTANPQMDYFAFSQAISDAVCYNVCRHIHIFNEQSKPFNEVKQYEQHEI